MIINIGENAALVHKQFIKPAFLSATFAQRKMLKGNHLYNGYDIYEFFQNIYYNSFVVIV